jgi:dihydrofolate reductase
MKEQPGKDILVFGSADPVHTLTQHNLIDEYRIMIHPVILGSGKRLFRDGTDKKVLRLMHTKTFSSGIVILFYEPAHASSLFLSPKRYLIVLILSL